LVVCGSDRDRRYRRLAVRHGIADQVKFLGFVDDVEATFAGCDLFAFPTFYDPCSLVVPEALQAGLPVLTSGCNGAAELIDDGKTGYVVADPWNLAAWADRLARLIDDETLRTEMSRRARKQAEGMTIDVRLAELTTVLRRLGAVKSTTPAKRKAA
jgi:UDP-glucose:(heptosyl)LPS alpha-1,3-glucosyltransferase